MKNLDRFFNSWMYWTLWMICWCLFIVGANWGITWLFWGGGFLVVMCFLFLWLFGMK